MFGAYMILTYDFKKIKITQIPLVPFLLVKDNDFYTGLIKTLESKILSPIQVMGKRQIIVHSIDSSLLTR